MRLFLFAILMIISTCNGQENEEIKKNFGIGILEVNTTYPISLYKNKKDCIPLDVLKFKIDKKGITHFITKLDLDPYIIDEGDSYQEEQENLNSGLISSSLILKFIVTKSKKKYFKIIINSETNESAYIKKLKENTYYETETELLKNNCSNCPNSKYNPRWYIYQTWERYLKSANLEKYNLFVYDKPNGKIIYEDKNNQYLSFDLIKIKSDWIKIITDNDNKFNLEKSKKIIGWTQWKNKKEILINILFEGGYE